jgi:hypothetical protein
MEKEPKEVFRELKEEAFAYAELKVELFKLGACEYTGKLLGTLSYGLVLMLLAFFVLLFLFLSGGFFLSECFQSYGLGFGCIVLIYLLITGIVRANKKRICLKIANEVIAALRSNEEKNSSSHEQAAKPSGQTAG